MDELINIPIKVKERSIIQSRTEHQDRHNPESASKITADPRSTVFQTRQIRSIFLTNPQSVRFLRLNPTIRKPIHPPHSVKNVVYVVSWHVTILFSKDVAAKIHTGFCSYVSPTHYEFFDRS